MSTTYIDGETVVFKSRGSNSVITLKPEVGKTLSIQGYGGGTSGLTTTVNLPIEDLGTVQQTMLQDNAEVTQMGTWVDTRNNYVIASGTNGTSNGGGAIVYAKSGGTYIEQQVLLGSVVTISTQTGLKCAFNEDATQCYLKSHTADPTTVHDLFSRSGSVWTRYGTITEYENLSLSGTRQIGGQFNGYVQVFNNGSVEQTLQDFQNNYSNGKFSAISTFGGVPGSVCCYTYGNGVKIWNRSGTTWTQTTAVAPPVIEGTPTVLEMNQTVIALAFTNRVYLIEYQDSTWRITTKIEEPNVTKIQLRDPDTVLLYKTNDISIYKRSTIGDQFYFASNEVLATDTNAAMNSTEIVIGRSTEGKAYVYSIVNSTASTTTSQIENSDALTLQSIYPVEVKSTESSPINAPVLDCLGDLKVRGTIQGSTRAQFAGLTMNYPSINSYDFTTVSGTDAVVTNGDFAATVSTDIFADCQTSELVCVNSGYFLVQANVKVASNATGVRQIRIVKNGSTDMNVSTYSAAHPSADSRLNASGIVYLAAGDYLQVSVLQNSGASLKVTGMQFQAVKVGN